MVRSEARKDDPDTGGQVNVAGLSLLQKLNLSMSALIPVSKSVNGVNESRSLSSGRGGEDVDYKAAVLH